MGHKPNSYSHAYSILCITVLDRKKVKIQSNVGGQLQGCALPCVFVLELCYLSQKRQDWDNTHPCIVPQLRLVSTCIKSLMNKMCM